MIQFLKSNRYKFAILLDQSIVSGTNFLFGILLARLLGLETYGEFVLAWIVVIFASSIHQAYIVQPMFTLYAKQKGKRAYLEALMGQQVWFSLITFAVILSVVEIVLIFFPSMRLPYVSLILGIVAALYVFNDFLRRKFLTLKIAKVTLIMDLFGYLLSLPLTLVMYQLGILSVINVIILMGVTNLISILIGMRYSFIRPSFERQSFIARLHWKFSKYLILTSFLQWGSGNLFLIVAGGILGPMSVGAIRIAQNIVGVLHVLFLAMENSIPLQASEIFQRKGRAQLKKYMIRVSKMIAIPVVGMLLMIVLFRKELIGLLYGDAFIQFDHVLVQFCILYVLVYIGTTIRFFIRTLEYNEIIFIGYVVSTIFSVLVAKPLVTSWHINGVLMGLFGVQLISITVYIFFLKRNLSWVSK